jgi:hypothetical protein
MSIFELVHACAISEAPVLQWGNVPAPTADHFVQLTDRSLKCFTACLSTSKQYYSDTQENQCYRVRTQVQMLLKRPVLESDAISHGRSGRGKMTSESIAILVLSAVPSGLTAANQKSVLLSSIRQAIAARELQMPTVGQTRLSIPQRQQKR